MARQAVFAGLIVDEQDQLVEATYVGDEPCYVVNDGGFRRHISAEQVDRQIFAEMTAQLKGHEDLISGEAAKMLGQDDIFSRAMIQNQLKNIDAQFDQLAETGIPESGRQYLGMMGFRVVINVHGEVVRIQQPSGVEGGDEGDDD